MARKPLLVPVTRSGSILHDTDCARGAASWEEADRINAELIEKVGDARWGVNYVMSEVQPFRASLRVVKHYHYKSSVHVELADRAGRTYPMFLGDLVPMLSATDMEGGWMPERTYEACKRSTAFGIRPVQEA